MDTKEKSYKNPEVLGLLNKIYQTEMKGVNQYLHYSFMIMGYNRIPIQKWFRENAMESIQHAIEIGEKITSLGGHPEMGYANIKESNNHSIKMLLEESLDFEAEGIQLYKNLVTLAANLDDIALEEMARAQVKTEIEHADEVKKMLKSPDL